MKNPLLLLWISIRNSIDEILRLVVLNLLWVACSLPLITLPASSIAMAYAVREMQQNPQTYTWKVFFSGFRIYFWAGWRWFLPNLALLIIFSANLLFFTVENTFITTLVKTGNLFFLLLWLVIQTFTLAFMVEQEKPAMWLAIRNSAVILFKFPGFTLLFTLFSWLVILLSLVLMMPWILFSVAMLTYIATDLLRLLREKMEIKPEEQA